jgi:threonine dehydratase
MNAPPSEHKSFYEAVRPATIIESVRLSSHFGCDITLASETFQHTGSFKFRAAYYLAKNVPNRELIAASSGNFGQALAYACSLLGKTCTIVMPDTSAQVKVDAVREHGGAVDFVDVRQKSRAERVVELAAANAEAYTTNAYDDPLIIRGNSSLGWELATLSRSFDYVIVPIGGGGLSSGVILGIRGTGKRIQVIGAEPAIANRTARSLRAGEIVQLESEPKTIADGARTISVGRLNWSILKDGLFDVIEVSEQRIAEAVRLLFAKSNLKAEATGALSVGALITEAERFRGKSVCCVISGGNVDAEVYSNLLKHSSGNSYQV